MLFPRSRGLLKSSLPLLVASFSFGRIVDQFPRLKKVIRTDGPDKGATTVSASDGAAALQRGFFKILCVGRI
jgi:hypothetical protein